MRHIGSLLLLISLLASLACSGAASLTGPATDGSVTATLTGQEPSSNNRGNRAALSVRGMTPSSSAHRAVLVGQEPSSNN